MNETTETSQLYEVGNKKFFAAALRSDGTFGKKEYHEGLMEVSIEFKSESTDISADDNLAFIKLSTPLTGEGTIKFAVLPYRVYKKFFDVKLDNNQVTLVKSRNQPKEVAIGFYSTAGDGSETMFTLYRAIFKQPALTTVSFDGKTIRDITLNVSVYPYEYVDADNEKDQVTYSIVNSKTNAAIWAKVQDEIYIPDTELQDDEDKDDPDETEEPGVGGV